jgi:hypothetical protein
MARLLARAAELRAAGSSWERVAAALRRSRRTCQTWPSRYPDQWRQFYQAAERRQCAEAGAEAVRTLRGQLRSDDEKTQRDVAKTLVRLVGRDRPCAATGGDPPAGDGPAADAEALTDEQLRELAEAVLREVAGGRAVAGGSSPPLPG